MASKKIGKQTFALCNPPSIAGHANVVGPKEGDGPLKDSFDVISPDASFGERSWEKAEVEMQKRALAAALEKAKQTTSVLDFLFAGDLLNQCISAGYAARSAGVPFFGLYGACSTMAESLSLAAMLLDGGFGEWGAAVTSTSARRSASTAPPWSMAASAPPPPSGPPRQRERWCWPRTGTGRISPT